MSIKSDSRTALVVIALCSQVGCVSAALPKMQIEQPIEIDRTRALSVRFKQDGREIDRSDMLDRLGERPESAADVRRARTLKTGGVVLGAVGGALIGIPLGQAIGGRSEPLWPLAYAGAGVAGVGISLGFWSDGSVNSAVEKHNRVSE